MIYLGMILLSIAFCYIIHNAMHNARTNDDIISEINKKYRKNK